MFWRFIIFFAISAGLLLSVQYAFYLAVAVFFSFSAKTTAWLKLFVLSMGGAFVFSIFAVRMFENFLTKTIYVISSVSMGVLWNALVAIAIAWIIRLALPFLSVQVHQYLGIFFLVASLAYSALGMYWAMYPAVKNVNLDLSGLPEEWRGKKIVQLSDIHLGVIYGAGHFQETVDIVNALSPDIILITGDIFDGMDGAMESFIAPLSKLKAEKGVYAITGNHEIYLGREKSLDIVKRAGISILDDRMAVIDGMQIGGVSYNLAGSEQGKAGYVSHVIGKWEGYDRNKPAIALYHVPASLAEFAEQGVDLLLSGHTHRGQQFPFSFLTKAMFKGYDYGLNHFGDMAVYTSSGVGSWGPPFKSNQRSEIVVFTLK